MKLSNQILVLVVGLLLLTFLAWFPMLADETHTGRFIAFSFFCFGGLALVPRFKHVNIQLVDLLLFTFYILNLVSVSWALNFGEAIFTSQKYLLLFIGIVLFKSILREHKKQQLSIATVLALMTLVALSVTTYQLMKVAGVEGLSGKSIYLVTGFSGHKNLTASLLFLLLGLNCYFLIGKKSSPLFYLLLVWQLVVIILLRSRAVYLASGLFIAINMGVFLISTPRLRSLALKRIIPIGFLLAVIGGGTLFNSDIAEDYKKYLNPATYSQSASAVERKFVWHKTSNLIFDQTWKGYGSGNWKLVFPSKNVSGGYRLQEKDLVFTRAHNDFLEVWTEVGTPGFLLYLSIFLLPLAIVIRAFWKAKPQQRAKWGILGSTLLGYMLIALFDFPKERIEHQAVLALIIALITYRPTQKGLNKPLWIVQDKRRYLLAVLVALLLSINIPISYYRFIGETCSKQILSKKDSGQLDFIIDQAQKGQSKWYNVDGLVVPLCWYKGVSEYKQEDYLAAKTSFGEAYQINPYNFNVINNYGSALVQNGEYEAAIEVYLQALEINPKFEEGMFNVAFSYFKLQQFDEALNWINQVKNNEEKRALFKRQITDAKNEFLLRDSTKTN